MKRLTFSLLMMVLMMAAASCISLNTTGINALSKKQRESIVRPQVPLDRLTPSDTIYIVDDEMVKAFLDDKEYAIIHSFLTWCKGKYCKNPAYSLKELRDAGLPFLMIAGDWESVNGFRADYPFISIDFDHYRTKDYSTGIERMYRNLGCGENWWELYSLYHRGQYVGSAQTLPELLDIYSSLTIPNE